MDCNHYMVDVRLECVVTLVSLVISFPISVFLMISAIWVILETLAISLILAIWMTLVILVIFLLLVFLENDGVLDLIQMMIQKMIQKMDWRQILMMDLNLIPMTDLMLNLRMGLMPIQKMNLNLMSPSLMSLN